MEKTHSRYKGLTAGVLVALRPEERAQLRQILFNQGSVSLQSFFRQAALQVIQAAHAQTQGSDEDRFSGARLREPADVVG